MLSLPRFTRSLLDSLDDDFFVFPLDYLHPTSHQQFNNNISNLRQRIAEPNFKDNKYQLSLDLRNFDPSDVSIKMDQNLLQIHGKREKKSEDGGRYEYREYQHHFTIPDNVIAEQLKCQLDPKGFLRVEAPVKVPGEDSKEKVRNIPIEFVKK